MFYFWERRGARDDAKAASNLLCCVECDHGGCARRYGSGDDTRTTGNIEQVALARAAQSSPETRSDLIVSLLGPMVEKVWDCRPNSSGRA
jgi:hypothetical protein